MEVTPESTQLPAVQQTPAEQELLPAQRASQLVPPQRTFARHAPNPVQLTVLLPPSSVTPAGHEDKPEHITLQAAAEHVTGAVHEAEPQLTVQLDSPHATWPQLDVALQSTVQEAAAVQSTAADVYAAAVTEQGMPGGHVHPVFEHCNTQVPPLHVPAVQSSTHVALAALSIDASDPALAAPSVDPSDPAGDDASGAASVVPSAAPGPPPSPSPR